MTIELEHFLFASNGELEDLILDYLGFPADGTELTGGGKLPRQEQLSSLNSESVLEESSGAGLYSAHS